MAEGLPDPTEQNLNRAVDNAVTSSVRPTGPGRGVEQLGPYEDTPERLKKEAREQKLGGGPRESQRQ